MITFVYFLSFAFCCSLLTLFVWALILWAAEQIGKVRR